jgi:hypothetical protein
MGFKPCFFHVQEVGQILIGSPWHHHQDSPPSETSLTNRENSGRFGSFLNPLLVNIPANHTFRWRSEIMQDTTKQDESRYLRRVVWHFCPCYLYLSCLNNVAATHANIRKTILVRDLIQTLPTSIFHVAVQLRLDNDDLFAVCFLLYSPFLTKIGSFSFLLRTGTYPSPS